MKTRAQLVEEMLVAHTNHEFDKVTQLAAMVTALALHELAERHGRV